MEQVHVLYDRVGVVEDATSSEIKKLSGQVETLRAKLEATSIGFKKDKFDPCRCRICFTKFPQQVSHEQQIVAIEDFVQKHCKERIVYSGHFGAKASFAHFATAKDAKSVLDNLRGKKMDDFGEVKVKAALSEIDVSRNWCLYKAYEMLGADRRTQGRRVELVHGKGRGVTVDGVIGFQQDERFDPRGGFVGAFSGLVLPS